MTIIQWAGAVILALALLEACLALGSGWRQRRRAVQEMDLRAERLAAQTGLLKSRRRRQELAWEGYRKFIVERKVEACEDVISIYLKPHDGLPIPDYKAGQHLTFKLRIPGREKPDIRCYSLSDAPQGRAQGHYRISVKRIPPPRSTPEAPPGLVSGYWHAGVNEADLVDVRAPKGNFLLDELSEQPVVLVAGGVGITPLLSMLRHLANRQSRQEVWLFYGVANRSQVLNPSELQEAAGPRPNFHLRFAFSHPTEDCIEGKDYQRQGYVSVDWIRDELGLPGDYLQIRDRRRPEFYICGPPPMMQAINGDLESWGVPVNQINYEAFGPASIKKIKRSDAAVPDEAQARHSIEFRRSGKTVDWVPDSGSLLEAATANDISMDCGCRCGDCGTCEIAVISGEVHYPDKEPGFDMHAGNCLACIGVPKSDLVLDA